MRLARTLLVLQLIIQRYLTHNEVLRDHESHSSLEENIETLTTGHENDYSASPFQQTGNNVENYVQEKTKHEAQSQLYAEGKKLF